MHALNALEWIAQPDVLKSMLLADATPPAADGPRRCSCCGEVGERSRLPMLPKVLRSQLCCKCAPVRPDIAGPPLPEGHVPVTDVLKLSKGCITWIHGADTEGGKLLVFSGHNKYEARGTVATYMWWVRAHGKRGLMWRTKDRVPVRADPIRAGDWRSFRKVRRRSCGRLTCDKTPYKDIAHRLRSGMTHPWCAA